MFEIFNQLKTKKEHRAKHGVLIDFLRSSPHSGYDISEDQTMCVAYFPEGVIIVAPYHQLTCIERRIS